MISVVVLTHNSQAELSSCLSSLSWCDEIIIIDDYSTDNTLKLAQKFNAKIYRRHLQNDFAAQRNFGLQKAQGDWVLFVDSDETVSSALARELQTLINLDPIGSPVLQGKIKRQDWFLGKKLKFGESGRNSFVRLAKKSAGRWIGKVHETWQIKGKTQQLKNPLSHRRNISVSQFLTRINYYSAIRAQELYQQGRRFNYLKLVLWPPAKFIYNYIFRLGFLDGFAGLSLALIMSLHSLFVRVKLYELEENQS
jgi:glycosyltransferase involved in cell wall biosynthesis